MSLKILRIHNCLYKSVNQFLGLFVDLIETSRKYDLLDQLQSILIKSRINPLEIIKAVIYFIIELNCITVNVNVHVCQFLEHVLQCI